MRRILVGLGLAALAWLSASPAHADIKPHALIGDGMVLQQGVECPIWGTADPGESISFSMSLGETGGSASGVASKEGAHKANANGKWRISLPKLKAGGPFTLTLKGKNTITIKDVYVGEVWLASGQSNMEMHLSSTATAKADIAKSKNPRIRLFTVPKRVKDKPQSSLDVSEKELKNNQGKWLECNPGTVGSFSAVAYYFGRDLEKALKVPVGIIHSSWGGTVAEAWTPLWALEVNPSLTYLADRAPAITGTLNPRNPNQPTVLYNGMIHPLRPYSIKGAIWYQGEANAGRAYEYRTLFPAMIQSWRVAWKERNFPFLTVQLAPWRAISKEPQESNWAELREAQLLTSLKLKYAGLAVITDVGEERDIHPKKKEPVGARLALAARALAYGQDITYSGPLYDSMKIEGNKVVLSFKHIGKGLEARGGNGEALEELKGFTIAGADRKFHNARAEIKGDKVIVWCKDVEKPMAVRYGWANFPVVNLINKEGLPASPFRTDDFEMITKPKKK
jgi:sialate O-acetylesterase